VFAVLGIEPIALPVLCKRCTTELYHQSSFLILCKSSDQPPPTSLPISSSSFIPGVAALSSTNSMLF
jgi:hypothetical protein